MTSQSLTLFYFISLLLFVTFSYVNAGSQSVEVTDDNWHQILEGEWMLKFYAPWCPACRNLHPIWADFATWSNDLGITVGHVDVTESPGLGGRFMIAALPTIYHVKNGVFRQYRGSRTKEEFLSFIEELKWEKVDPVSSLAAPDSVQMSIVSQFYRMSLYLRNIMTALTTQYGLPVWATYLIFGGLTILIGIILGLFLVCLIDLVYMPSRGKLTCSSKPSQPAPIQDLKNRDSSDGLDSDGDTDQEPNTERVSPTVAGHAQAAGTARKRRATKVD